MLLVGLVRQRRDRRCIHVGDESPLCIGICGIVNSQARKPLAQQAAYSTANDAVGDETLFGPVDRLPGGITHGGALGWKLGGSMSNYVTSVNRMRSTRQNVGTQDFRPRRHDSIPLAQRGEPPTNTGTSATLTSAEVFP